MLVVPLEERYLSEKDANRLYSKHPEIKKSFKDYCPTCLTHKTYVWEGKTIDCDCKSQLNLHKQFLNAGIGVLYQRYSWLDYNGDQNMKDGVDLYLDQSERMVAAGIGIVARGKFGVGKTMALNLLLKDLLREGYSVFATTFTSMIEMFTAGWTSVDDKKIFEEKMSMSQILLLDDLGKEMKTKSALSEHTFDHVLRSRVQNGRPTFITTNMTVAEMTNGYGGAVMSLLNETSIPVDVVGSDYRQRAGNRKIQEVLAGETRPIM